LRRQSLIGYFLCKGETMKALTSILYSKVEGTGKNKKTTRGTILAGAPIPDELFSAKELADLIRRDAIGEDVEPEDDSGFETVTLTGDVERDKDHPWHGLKAGQNLSVTNAEAEILREEGLID
jgi:hypothetical protein